MDIKKIKYKILIFLICILQTGCVSDILKHNEPSGYADKIGGASHDDGGSKLSRVDNKSHVVIFYLSGFNNLSSYLENNLEQIKNSAVPRNNQYNKIVLVFQRFTNGNYKNKTEALLYRLYRDTTGEVKADTLLAYSERTTTASAETMRNMLSFVKEKYRNATYGLVFGSHGTGWLPPGLYGNIRTIKPEEPVLKQSGRVSPLSINREDNDGSSYYEIDLKDFAAAIPMKLEYIIFDMCFIGSAEVAYELKDKTRYIVASPTEILASGMYYPTMLQSLFEHKEPDLKQICINYFDYYKKKGEYATISLIDCTRLEDLASTLKPLYEKYREKIKYLNKDDIQKFFRKHDRKYGYFYDLKDILTHCGISNDESDLVDRALNSCVIYKDYTDSFIDLKIKAYSGMSVYLPHSEDPSSLKEYYKALQWNKKTLLVK